MSKTSFLELFSLSLGEVLTEREQTFVELRYGLVSGEPLTLEQVGQIFSLSRERIRQVLDRSLYKIAHRGWRDLRAGKTTGPCAALRLFAEDVCLPHELGYQERILQFVHEELPHLPHKTWALPLVLGFLYTEADAKDTLKELLRFDKKATTEQRQQAKEHKLANEFRRIFSQALWPRRQQTDAQRFYSLVDSSLPRTVIHDGLGRAGWFLSQKLNRDVVYRSQLERRVLQQLEAAEEVVWYQEQPFLVTGEAYGASRTVHPDLLFVLNDGRGVIGEVTLWTHMALRKNLMKYEVLRLFCVENGLGLLITDGRKTFRQIRQHSFPSAFEQALLDALAHAPTHALSWQEYQAIREQYAASWRDLMAIIVANRLDWSLQPFTLQKSTCD